MLLAIGYRSKSGSDFVYTGSDFVEMFAGVGAADKRFICAHFHREIDNRRSRGRGQMPGSNDERENTLNSLLVEMDRFRSIQNCRR